MKISLKEIVIIGLMLVFVFVLDVMFVEMLIVWGMKIDFVVVLIIVVYFIFGFWGGLIVFVMFFFGLSVVFFVSWLGVMMKILVMFGVFVGFEVVRRILGFDYFDKKWFFVFGLVVYIVGIFFRILLMIVFNYYVVFFIWLGFFRE